MKPVTRPVLRWYGGKFRLAPWIIEHMPPHRVYVEPYGGAASVLLRKKRSYAEVYNDIDGEVVNFFRVLRDPELSVRLLTLLELTPFARDEFDAAYEPPDDPVERARALAVLAFMGFGSNAHAKEATGFRACSNRSGTTPAHDWRNYPRALAAAIERFRGVVIENRDAMKVMAAHDGERTLHYVDPPYVWDTRGMAQRGRGYHTELTDAEHAELLNYFRGLRGRVLLSGYAHPIYDDGARKRTEVLWINDAAQMRARGPLFEREGLAA